MKLFRHAPLAIALTLLAGCASKPPFSAGWYLHDPVSIPPAATPENPAPPRNGVYLAILNQSDKPLPLSRIIVNPVTNQQGGGISIPADSAGRAWLPGEMRVYWLEERLGRCTLPVEVQIECDAGCRPQRKAVTGGLPTALRDVWLTSCPAPLASGEKR
jgi:hypothetical protein